MLDTSFVGLANGTRRYQILWLYQIKEDDEDRNTTTGGESYVQWGTGVVTDTHLLQYQRHPKLCHSNRLRDQDIDYSVSPSGEVRIRVEIESRHERRDEQP